MSRCTLEEKYEKRTGKRRENFKGKRRGQKIGSKMYTKTGENT
jgi:hypothetical protein